jgi:hypothetical protein
MIQFVADMSNIPNPESYTTRIDPSAENLPPVMDEAYASMNDVIADDRAAFGLTLQIEHLTLSRNNISATADEALCRAKQGEERTAVVLGAGGCGDIPLKELVTNFDRTTLVDVHTAQTEQALSFMPANLLGKITLVKADISGIAQGFGTIFERASEGRNFQEFLAAAHTMVHSLDVVGSQVDLGERYSFVCSQLLMTQLHSIPAVHFSKLVAERYGRPLTMVPGGEDHDLCEALNDTNVSLQTGHIDYLGRHVKPNGTVHLADTIVEVQGTQTLPMVTHDALDKIDVGFEPLREAATWDYIATPRTHFYVASFALAPKQSE